MAFAKTIHKGRTKTFTVTLYESDGSTGIELAPTDVVRAKVYRRGQATPVLDLDSAAASANGSTISITQLTAPATADVKIVGSDTASLDTGPYSFEISIVDDSDSDRIKHAETGVLWVQPSGGGDTGLA